MRAWSGHGYVVVSQKGRLTRERLRGFNVLVLTVAMGFRFREGVKSLPGLGHNLKGDAFTPEECAIVRMLAVIRRRSFPVIRRQDSCGPAEL